MLFCAQCQFKMACMDKNNSATLVQCLSNSGRKMSTPEPQSGKDSREATCRSPPPGLTGPASFRSTSQNQAQSMSKTNQRTIPCVTPEKSQPRNHLEPCGEKNEIEDTSARTDNMTILWSANSIASRSSGVPGNRDQTNGNKVFESPGQAHIDDRMGPCKSAYQTKRRKGFLQPGPVQEMHVGGTGSESIATSDESIVAASEFDGVSTYDVIRDEKLSQCVTSAKSPSGFVYHKISDFCHADGNATCFSSSREILRQDKAKDKILGCRFQSKTFALYRKRIFPRFDRSIAKRGAPSGNAKTKTATRRIKRLAKILFGRTNVTKYEFEVCRKHLHLAEKWGSSTARFMKLIRVLWMRYSGRKPSLTNGTRQKLLRIQGALFSVTPSPSTLRLHGTEFEMVGKLRNAFKRPTERYFKSFEKTRHEHCVRKVNVWYGKQKTSEKGV
jgi:hypothetical protein